jgi:hypothetical protein
MNRLNSVDGSDLGCVIDCSQGSAHEFDYRVITLAYENGYDVDYAQLQNDMEMYDELSYEEVADVNQGLWEECALALDWLNSQIEDKRFAFYVDDNCLFLGYEDGEGSEYNLND